VTLLAVLAGAALIFAALRDIFHELFHPAGTGSISGALMRVVWRLFRRAALLRPGVLTLAGPAALVAVIAGWAALLAVGWALIYWPFLPEGFLLATGLDPSTQGGFLDALYLSVVTLATLGYGDIAPTDGLLRLLAPLEALVGFGLLTASITWVLSIYPALSRRRTLAHEILLLRDAEPETEAAGALIGELVSRLTAVRSDFLQYPIIYYFHSTDEKESLATALSYLTRLAKEVGDSNAPVDVRLRSAMLRAAIDDLAATLAAYFLSLPSAPTDKTLAAYARDHLRTPLNNGG
jgi:voltage-gated potassium channel Kch